MKKILVICLGLGITLQLNAQIVFEQGTWAEVKAKAKKEKKMIFVDAYTTWCGPCKWMSTNTFTDKSVGEYYNANFVNYKFDMEKGEGVQFANDFAVNAYPTLLYFTPDAQVAHRSEGSQGASSFLEKGRVVKEGNGNEEEPAEEPKEEEVPMEEGEPEWSKLNSKAWEYYETETNKAKLEEAVQWAMQSIELDKNFYNTDTYAHLLYKLAKKQEALKWANTALTLGKQSGDDVTATEELIRKIKGSKK
jgi:thiol-disulfide isomerase/thioredoxin